MLRDAVPVLVRGAVKYPRGTLSSLAEGADGGAGVANGSSRKLILAIFPTRLMRRQPSMRRQTFLHIPSGETRFRAPADKMTLTTLQIFHQSGSISGRAGLLSLPAAVCVERRGGGMKGKKRWVWRSSLPLPPLPAFLPRCVIHLVLLQKDMTTLESVKPMVLIQATRAYSRVKVLFP